MTVIEMAQWTAVLGTVAQWLAFGATTAAVIVALFKEELIRRYIRHPELTARIDAKYPYIVRTRHREQEWRGWRYFIRLRIGNAGTLRADKVEVFLSQALIQRNGSYEPLPNFTPMNLRWSNRTDIYVDGISPDMERFCDFGAISDPATPSLQSLSDADTRLWLWLETLAPNTEWLRPGRYKFKVLVAAGNCDPKAYWISLHLTGYWDNEPTKMLSNGIVLDCHEG
jgi:hypothetical protein